MQVETMKATELMPLRLIGVETHTCRKCQAAKELGKRCAECHKRRCKAWHDRFVKGGVPRVDPEEQKRLEKNRKERERRASKKARKR